MTAKEMWDCYCAVSGVADCGFEAWSFGSNPDLLAELVLRGEKTATASAYLCYEMEKEPLPAVGKYSVVLDAQESAVCVIQTTAVSLCPFCQVSEEHACREGEKDKSLDGWRRIHRDFFTEELKAYGRSFDEQILVVCEEFQRVYPLLSDK